MIEEDIQINPLLQQLRENPIATPIYDYFVNSEGLRLFYRTFEPKSQEIRRIIIGCHGMGGDGEYFTLLADQIVEQTNSAFYIMDYRGHGRSEGAKGDIKKFELYLEDLKEFITFIQQKNPNIPLLILGESMGGIVSINFVARNPEIFSGIIEFAPAVRLHLTAFSIVDAFKAVGYFFVYLFAPGKPVIGSKGREDVGVRNEIHQQYDRTNLYHLEAVSPRYILQLNKFSKISYKSGFKIKAPIIIFQGEGDKLVSVEGVKIFFGTVASEDKELVLYPEAYHVLFTDPYAGDLWDKLRSWIKAH
jgi:alpha-beta hydrolase superfamily lysophospholipase